MSTAAEYLSDFSQKLGMSVDEMKPLVDYYSSLATGNDDGLLSTRFRPSSSEMIIGNKDSVAFVKSWLADWAKKPPIELNANGTPSWSKKRKVRLDDSDSDFRPDFDEDDDDEEGNLNRALLIVGPCGCGKTATIYTLCQEQGFKVVEINASSIRSGKVLTEQFKAATGLHRVDANSLLKESVFNSELKSSPTGSDICLEKGANSKKNGENNAGLAQSKTKLDVQSAFQKLFGGAASKPKSEKNETIEMKKEKSVEKQASSSKGPLDGWISRPKAKAVKDSEKAVAPEKPLKNGTPKSCKPEPSESKSGKKRKSSAKSAHVIVVESDEEVEDSIVIDESDDDDDFQVKKRRKKPSKKAARPSKVAEDSDVEAPIVKHVRPSTGLTLDLKTLYLIDEADLIFNDSDVGFAAALCRLIATGEKPFILTASSTQGIDRNLLAFCLLVEMLRPSEEELTKHLAAIVLSTHQSGEVISISSLKSLVKSAKCDVRLALNSLQFNCFDGECKSSSELPEYLPQRSIVRNLMARSQIDALLGEVGLHWDTNGVYMKDSIEDSVASNYRNILDLRDEMRHSAGNTLGFIASRFPSAYGFTRRREEDEGEAAAKTTSTAVYDVCSCLDQLILGGREGFAEHMLCGVDHPYRYFHDRSRMIRFADCASAVRDICRSEVERKLTCNDRQRRRFFHYLTDCGITMPESGIHCLPIKQ